MSAFVHYSTKVKDYRKCDTTPDKCNYGESNHHPIEPGETVQEAIEKANAKHFANSVGSGKKRATVTTASDVDTVNNDDGSASYDWQGSEYDNGEQENKKYDLHLAAFEKVQKSIKKNNRRLERAGIPQRFEVDARRYTKIQKQDNGFEYEDERVEFTLNHPQISYQGYHFLARVEEVSKGNYVAYTAPDAELKGWRPDSMKCEYCNKNIARNKVYVIADEDGNKKVVGGKCIEIYTGMRPSNLWAMEYDVENELESSDYEPNEPTGAKRVDKTDDLLKVAYVISEKEGYRSKDYGGDSTTSKVDDVLHPPTKQSRDDAYWSSEVLEKAQSVDISKVKDEVREAIKGSDSDWAHNLRTFLNEEYVNSRGRGTVISAMAALHKRREQKQKSSEWAKGFIGKEGEKVTDIKAKVVNSAVTEGYYGPVVNLTMQTSDGNRVFWQTSSAKIPKKGDNIVFNATIKDTSTWRDVDSTRVIRAKWKISEDEESGSDENKDAEKD